jgi:hypothetical protein
MSAAFTLDTSGSIWSAPEGIARRLMTWRDLSPFAQGYVEAMFTASYGDIRADIAGAQGWDGDREPAFADLAPETLARIIADCEAFVAEPTVIVDARYGRNFWRVRQRGDLPKFPPLTVQLGDDGKVRFAD